MAARAGAEPQLRSFDMGHELRATAERRKKQTPTVAAAPFAREGIPQIAARLAVMFPQLGQDIAHGVLSELFRADAKCSREQLADRATAQLLEMSADDGTPHAVTSFEPCFCDDGAAQTTNDSAATTCGRPAEQITDQSITDLPGPADGGPMIVDGEEEELDAVLAALLSLPDEALSACCRTLEGILRRILEAPEDERYRRLKRSNARFQADVGCHSAGVEMLLFAGFQEEDVAGAGPSFVFKDDPAKSCTFLRAWEALNGVMEDMGLTAKAVPAPKSSSPASAPPVQGLGSGLHYSARDSRRQRIAELTEQRLQNPHDFRQAAKARGSGNHSVGSGHFRRAPVRTTEQEDAKPSRRSQHFTLSDINRMRVSDEIANMPNYAEEYRQAMQNSPARDYSTLVSRSYDPELIGRQSLDLTNRYRASKGLAPLRWHGGIAKIAARHAEQMASGAMPFSHDGFNDRVAAFPVAQRAAAENLAWNQGHAEVAQVAVDGWIKSPGHEKNLRGDYNLCGIGVARASNGAFYLTQLFAHAI